MMTVIYVQILLGKYNAAGSRISRNSKQKWSTGLCDN